MPDHDLVAELGAYRDELRTAVAFGRQDKAAAVRAEIDRVEALVASRAVELRAEAIQRDADGQDSSAVKAEAARLEGALPVKAAAPVVERAVADGAQETAVPARRAAKKGTDQ